ncbi:MAG: CoB--CoM heterodisulfide reductase iron-sulfur subunit B family protein [Deltaproteobacteria bacterium]|nr:CoB--CoM heterodisulfide reductase iron-sulfur subunit B family protein [Deltaproteobacteria bacterium]
MMFALFLGCKIPYYVPQYETSIRAVSKVLDLDLVHLEFNCCGYPVRHLDSRSFLFAAARNFALAEKEGLDIITPCKCCFGTLKKAEYYLKEKPRLREEINLRLKHEGLRYRGIVQIKHFLSVLFHDVELDVIKKKIKNPYKKLNIAVHYGCHALRPSRVVQFDNPVAPTKFDQLVELTGATSVPWALKLQCCGNPLMDKNEKLARDLMAKKLADGLAAGADYLCVACTYCQIQFDLGQADMVAARTGHRILPSLLYPQLLGLSLGLSREALGLDQNRLGGDRIGEYLTQPSGARS